MTAFLKRNESALVVTVPIVVAVGALLGVLLPEIRHVRTELASTNERIDDTRKELAGKIDDTNARIDRVLEALAGIGDVAADIKAMRADDGRG